MIRTLTLQYDELNEGILAAALAPIMDVDGIEIITEPQMLIPPNYQAVRITTYEKGERK